MQPRKASPPDARRPPVAVLMPFRGDAPAAVRALDALAQIELRPGDEVIVADNSDAGLFAAVASGRGWPRVLPATGERSSYHARNVAAEGADGDWLLFLDADCRPPADLLDRYFGRRIDSACGLVAGAVVGAKEQSSLVARWSRSRSLLSSKQLSAAHPKPFGVTANLLVRRIALEAVGGFQEGIRSGGDAEFCWRVQEAGWELLHAPEAVVEHVHRDTVRARARVAAHKGAGRAWINRHRPGSTPRPWPVRGLLRCAVAAPLLAITGRFERARFKLIDAVEITATAVGYLLSNRPPGSASAGSAPPGAPATAILRDSFPALSETFVAAEARALLRLGLPVRVEALQRPERPNRVAASGLATAYIEDESYLGRVWALLALAARHPLRAIRDGVTSRRWPAADRVPLVSLAPMARRLEAWGARHLHAHFATTAAVSAARVARLLGISHSVTAHAHEIFRRPGPLKERLEGASFVTTGCEYNVSYLRDRVLDGSPPLHEIVMGVDVERFKRDKPYPGGRRVLAVGRLVPKKGFADLIEAAAELERDLPLDALTIVGEGEQRGELERLVGEKSLEHRVTLPGALDPSRVREELERSDLLVMPSVVAADGDRDSMPVVVKEALAMELPVVATDEVGLPELVRPEFGRLVPPGEPASLARAIAEVLGLGADERAAMGARGRAWVAEHASIDRETRKLAGLIASASSS
jgi:colanic acid/amylovoran biosynthesis glycosyltransferase